jgi:hypothetical protein
MSKGFVQIADPEIENPKSKIENPYRSEFT